MCAYHSVNIAKTVMLVIFTSFGIVGCNSYSPQTVSIGPTAQGLHTPTSTVTSLLSASPSVAATLSTSVPTLSECSGQSIAILYDYLSSKSNQTKVSGVFLACSDGSSSQLVYSTEDMLVGSGKTESILHIASRVSKPVVISNFDVGSFTLSQVASIDDYASVNWNSNDDYMLYTVPSGFQQPNSSYSLRLLHIPTESVSILETDGVRTTFSMSPDGTRIFYAFVPPEAHGLQSGVIVLASLVCDPVSYICKLENKHEMRNVFPNAVWLPNSQEILTVSQVEAEHMKFVIVDTQDNIMRKIDIGQLDPSIDRIWAFSANGDGQIAFVGDMGKYKDVFVLDTQTLALTKITSSEREINYPELVWLP